MKKKILIVLVTLLLIVSAAIGVLIATNNLDKQFIIETDKITAAYLDANEVFSAGDSEDVFKVKVKEAVNYFKDNKINTVILQFNENESSISEIKGFTNIYAQASYFEKKDIIQRLKSAFASDNIQLILSLNCNEFLDSEVLSTVAELNKKYQLAGISLTNYIGTAQNLQTIKLNTNKTHKKFHFVIEQDTAENIMSIQELGVVDFYIFNKIDEQEYRRLKQGIFANETILFSYRTEKFLSDLFLIANFSELDGLIITQYTDPNTDLGMYQNMIDISSPIEKFNFTIPTDFKVSYPKADMSTNYGGIFVTGVANPNDKVYINNQEVTPATDGTFGYHVELQVGDNIITVEQKGQFTQFIVTRKTYSSSGGGSKPTYDSTQQAQAGQKVKTMGPLTSALTNLHDDGSIMEGIPKGTVLEVVESETTTRSGKYTYAYKLSNGAYVLAKNVEWLNESYYTKPVIQNVAVQALENSDEYLTITNTGRPAIFSSFEDEQLQFVFLNTDVGANISNELLALNSAKTSKLIDNLSIEKDGVNTVVTIKNVVGNEIWGYNIETDQDGLTKIYLKKTPHKAKGDKPLTGVTIMLDPGHGLQDGGAPAVGGINGPGEKDLNLAVARATKICLEKMGATVYMTREDDSFPTLDERRELANSLKPDLFISQHHNSLDMSVDGAAVFGTEVYYFTGQSKSVAEALAKDISTLTNRRNRGEKFSYFYVTRTDIAPSVLAEYGFMLNPYEYATMHSDIDIYKAAFGTATAILEIIPE